MFRRREAEGLPLDEDDEAPGDVPWWQDAEERAQREQEQAGYRAKLTGDPVADMLERALERGENPDLDLFL